MAAIVGQSEEVHAFVKALGLDIRGINTITMYIKPDEVVLIEVEQIVQGDQLDKMSKEIIKYKLYAKEEEDE